MMKCEKKKKKTASFYRHCEGNKLVKNVAVIQRRGGVDYELDTWLRGLLFAF